MKILFFKETPLDMEADDAEIAVSEVDIDRGFFSKIKETVVSFVRNLLSPYPSRKKELSAAAQTAGIGGNSVLTLLVIGIIAIVFGQQTAMAQTVNSPGSVLHGRTIQVADKILEALGPSITRYNQVTNLAQLSGITSLNLHNRITSLQAGDFKGLTNLESLDISKSYNYADVYGSLTHSGSGGSLYYKYHTRIVQDSPLRTPSHQRFNQGYSTISSI